MQAGTAYEGFQSTPPARGATRRSGKLNGYRIISIHAPREGGDLTVFVHGTAGGISIHAPREGGDDINDVAIIVTLRFQSTPPARGATGRKLGDSPASRISIHAPREGGDVDAQLRQQIPVDFNPRPPRGGRRQTV